MDEKKRTTKEIRGEGGEVDSGTDSPSRSLLDLLLHVVRTHLVGGSVGPHSDSGAIFGSKKCRDFSALPLDLKESAGRVSECRSESGNLHLLMKEMPGAALEVREGAGRDGRATQWTSHRNEDTWV